MNATLEQIKPETVELLEKQAEKFGLSVDDYLRRLLPTDEQELALQADVKDIDFEADMKSFSEGTENLPEHNGTYSREEIYAEDSIEEENKRQKSIAWIKSHREEYGGMFVALDGDKLIGTGKRYGDALKLARQKGFQNAFIGDVLPLDYEGYMGGFD